MHILLVADGRSPITKRWVKAVLALGHQVTLVSSFTCEHLPGTQVTYTFPVAFSQLAGSQIGSPSSTRSMLNSPQKAVSRFRSPFLAARYILGPLTLPHYGARFQRLVKAIQPDLVHALRIPFEGMLAAYTPPNIPFAVSVWGNDLTFHAHGSIQMGVHTRQTLKRADALLADAHRDIRLGQQLGFDPNRPTLVVPGSAGIDLVEMHRLRAESDQSFADLLPAGIPLVVNPRGFRPGSVRNDVFFQAISLVRERFPKVCFVCTGMANQSEAMQWVRRLHLENQVRLLPFLPQAELWNIFSRASILVSISAHDGTPNSFLEGIACGCFPIVGDIESLREWITPGVNGLLVPPDQPQAVAEALLTLFSQPKMIQSGAEYNLRLIQNRAESNLVRAQIEVFYNRLTT
jgi:glycosyltransferase involved in cell wall biosynthesis